jgi:hypothetical protein
MRRKVITSLVMGIAWGAVFAASTDSLNVPVRRTGLTIRSTPDSAIVVVDGTLMGQTPLHLDTLAAGTHIVRLLNPDSTSWFTDNITDTINVESGQHPTLSYNLPRRYLINTIPSGAGVYIGDSLAGETPTILESGYLPPGMMLTVRKPGYLSASVSLHGIQGSSVVLPLAPTGRSEAEKALFARAEVGPGKSSLPLYITGAAAVIFGTAAAYFKVQADRKNDEYLISGDAVLAAERNRLDSWAATCTVTMQVNVGIFIYFLLANEHPTTVSP